MCRSALGVFELEIEKRARNTKQMGRIEYFSNIGIPSISSEESTTIICLFVCWPIMPMHALPKTQGGRPKPDTPAIFHL